MEGGTRGSPRDPMEGLLEMGGNLWEPKGAHGRGPLGASGFPCEVTLGNPGDPMTRGREPKGSHWRGTMFTAMAYASARPWAIRERQ